MSTDPKVPGVGPVAAEPASSPRRGGGSTRAGDVHEVVFIAYPKLLFIWPLILAGFLFWPLSHWGLDAGVLGWAYLFVLAFVLLTLGVDVDRNQAAFWVVLVAALWILGMWLQDRQWTLFGDIYRFFAAMNVRYDKGFGLGVSMVMLVPFTIMLLWARFNDRWRITHNEFEHYSFGRMDDSLGRGAKTIRTSFPDVFEALLGLAGTLIVYNATGTQELRRIPHVMFLPLVRRRLNKVLERMAVTSMMAAQAEEEEDV